MGLWGVVWWCIGAEASEKHTHQLPSPACSTANRPSPLPLLARPSKVRDGPAGRWQTWASLGLRRPPGVPVRTALSRRARNGANFAIAVEIRPGLLLERGDGGGDGALRRTRCRLG